MKTKQGHLTLAERQLIYKLRSDGQGIRNIAKIVGRSASTVSREIIRNLGRQDYRFGPLERALIANNKARERRSSWRRGRERSFMRLQPVSDLIKGWIVTEQLSPLQVELRLKRDYPKQIVSRMTIYRWVHSSGAELKQHLRLRGKKPRNRVATRRWREHEKAAKPKRSIWIRPSNVDDHIEQGHYEMDTVVCSQSTASILSVRELATRKRWYRIVPNLKAHTVTAALLNIFLSLPAAVRLTITADNGPEFADWHILEQRLGVKVYFCDPYAAYQKGSVELSNRDFRWYVPKGTDLQSLTPEFVHSIETKLNSRPMLCLDGDSPDQAWRLVA
jgi:IS30 family transposase